MLLLKEKEVVKKGNERMEKQISQLNSVFISQEQVDIALLKKCKTVNVPAVNSAIEMSRELYRRMWGLKEWNLSSVTKSRI